MSEILKIGRRLKNKINIQEDISLLINVNDKDTCRKKKQRRDLKKTLIRCCIPNKTKTRMRGQPYVEKWSLTLRFIMWRKSYNKIELWSSERKIQRPWKTILKINLATKRRKIKSNYVNPRAEFKLCK